MTHLRRWLQSFPYKTAVFLLLASGLVDITWRAYQSFFTCPSRLPLERVAEPKHETELKRYVELLSRLNSRPASSKEVMQSKAELVEAEWRKQGYRTVADAKKGQWKVTKKGTQIYGALVVAAHLDPLEAKTGADDNDSGLAMLLALSESVSRREMKRSVTFIVYDSKRTEFFTPPKNAPEFTEYVFLLDGLGIYSPEKGSQHYHSFFSWFYPHQGNFIGFFASQKANGILNIASTAFNSKCELRAQCLKALPLVGMPIQPHVRIAPEDAQKTVIITDTGAYRVPSSTPGTGRSFDVEKMEAFRYGFSNTLVDLANIG